MGSINLYENGALNSLNGSGIVPCEYEVAAAALNNHNVGDILYIKFNNAFDTYRVIAQFNKGAQIVINTQVELYNSTGKQLFVKGFPTKGEGGGGEGGATILKTFYVPSHTTEAVDEDSIIYYSDKKLYKVVKTGGLPADYDVVPNTDLELMTDLDENVLVSAEGVPGGIFNASDVAFDNTGTGLEADDVQEAISEINSKMAVLLWENQSPSSDMAGNTEINLSSSDYDYLKIFYNITTSGVGCLSVDVLKGSSAHIQYLTGNTEAVYAHVRVLTRVSDTKYKASTEGSYPGSPHNNYCIPVKIYGYKF